MKIGLASGLLLFLSFAAVTAADGGGVARAATPAAKTTPAITWKTPAPIPFGVALSSQQLNATASVAGSFSYSPAAGTYLPSGTRKLTATFTPSNPSKYTAATASVTLKVTAPATRVVPTITWPAPAPITYGTALNAKQLNATAAWKGGQVAGSFVYSPATGTKPAAGIVTLKAAFSASDSTDFAKAQASVKLTVNPATPVVSWTPPSALTTGQNLSTVLTAKLSVAGSCAYSAAKTGSAAVGVTAKTVLQSGVYSVAAKCVPADANDYRTVTAGAQLAVMPNGSALVDFGAKKQFIRGFGGSTAWMWTMAPAAMDNLFGQTGQQIGLSMLRMRIDPGGSASDPSPWDAELNTALEAMARAPDAQIFATPWTPPAAFKEQTTQFQYYQGNPLYGGILDPNHYGDYANYLRDYVAYMKKNKVKLAGISMQNEPDWNATYEACNWTPEQMHTWVHDYGKTPGAPLIMPESAWFNPAYADPSLEDPVSAAQIGIVGGHLYGTSPSAYPLAVQLGKELWMTEHSLDPAGTDSNTHPLPAASDAVAMALEIHNSMVSAGYNAYVWWWVYNWFPEMNTGLIDSSYNPTYFGYAIGQFSRFVRPGYYRVSAIANPADGINVSAYTGKGHTTIVAINASGAAVSLPFFLENAAVTSVTPYVTSAEGGLQQQPAVAVSGGSFTYSLPAQSISTFVR